MWKLRSVFVCFLFCATAILVAGQRSKWQTLNGEDPLVIARGGFSGLFPDSSLNSYLIAVSTSLPNVILWCDVQLTKDGAGICFPDVKLENGSDINRVLPDQKTKYIVNGISTEGWFSVDYTLKDLQSITLSQGIYSRSNRLDGVPQPPVTVEDMVKQIRPPGLWLNIQHDAFFSQHNLSMRSFVLSVSRRVIVNYISSPEVNFLRSIVDRFKRSPTKLIFRFLRQETIEPSTNQTYGSLLQNLTFIKTFAAGILVPKSYIWTMGSDYYLQSSTSLVLDAHKAGLSIFASDFANDASFAYNYSYDPVAEYLSFVDNGEFSVDGVLSDHPVTPSAAIDCLSHIGNNDTKTANVVVISSEGASGDYPGCTDLAYNKAITDGVDVLDCPVQLTQDGIPICLGSINLLDRTNVATSEFGDHLTSIPELNVKNGLYAFNLTWKQIQTLKPAITNPFVDYSLHRNPRFSNSGNFVLLSDFLSLAKNSSSVSGVLIIIENAAYLAANQGLGVTDAVLEALSKASYANQTAKKVMIQSTDSSVLENLTKSGYELVYRIDEIIRDITNSTVMEIKNFASSVVISRASVFPTSAAFTTGSTKVVSKLQAFNLSVYVRVFQNEFVSQAWDFFSDPYIELTTFVGEGINGVVTAFPKTANKFRRNRCLGYEVVPTYMAPVPPAGLLEVMNPYDFPPTEAPSPILSEADVDEPPLPAVLERARAPSILNAIVPAAGPPPPNGQGVSAASVVLSSFAVLLATIIIFS